ncbi:MAG: hypothetical protein IKP37_13905 [Paludibacteraceae bacterium]|nr:hypothetical protein [Paludibacteraceae bacterium]
MQKLLSAKQVVDNQYKYICFKVSKVTPRDGGWTENMQKSANEAAVKKRKCKELQKRFSSPLFIHIR